MMVPAAAGPMILLKIFGKMQMSIFPENFLPSVPFLWEVPSLEDWPDWESSGQMTLHSCGALITSSVRSRSLLPIQIIKITMPAGAALF